MARFGQFFQLVNQHNLGYFVPAPQKRGPQMKPRSCGCLEAQNANKAEEISDGKQRNWYQDEKHSGEDPAEPCSKEEDKSVVDQD